MELPPTAPIMVLGGAPLFPHTMLPLYIFETRYRRMLERSLETDRLVCIASVRPGVEEWKTEEDFHAVAGLGLVRACVGRPDGTSHLVLQGLARVRLEAFPQRKPFYVAEITELPAQKGDPAEGARLSRETLEWCRRFRERGVELPEQLDEHLARLDDPGVLSDVVANTFVADARIRQSLLEETDELERLRVLVAALHAQFEG